MSDRLDAFAPATEMLAALRARRVSAVELLDLHLERIARLNPPLNAIVEPDFERARRDAAGADTRRARGENAPLLGLPMTLKESINVRGLRTTAGMPFWKDFRSEHDAPVTTRVKGAGAVVMAKTNVPQMLADWQSNNPVYGRTNNPWDLARTPGGSTGGGAAALAAGLTPLEFGSDIGGSIRVPAAFCGVYGHRPSETAMPRSGQFPFPPLPNAAVVMGVQGPLARWAEDLEIALDIAAGPEVGEDVGWRLSIPAARRERLSEFRVAVLPTIEWLPLDAEIAAALDSLVSRLGRIGCRIKTAQPDALGDHREHYAFYLTLLAAVTSARLPAEQRGAPARRHAHARRRVERGAPARNRERRPGLRGLGRTARAVSRRLARVLPRVGRAVGAGVLRAGVSALGQAVAGNSRVHRENPRRQRQAGAGGAGTGLPIGGHAGRPARDGVPRRPHAGRLADRSPGDRPLPGRPHPDPLRRPDRARIRRLHPPPRG